MEIKNEVKKEEVKEIKNEEIKEIKNEVKKESDVSQTPEHKEEAPKQKLPEKTEFEKSLEIIRNLIAKQKDLKLMEQEAKTGYSFFSGKNRLCKILKSKRGITLEINTKLPEKFKEIPELESISAAVAYKKHLGTMKYLYRGQDSKLVKELITAAIEQMKSEFKSEKQDEAKAQ